MQRKYFLFLCIISSSLCCFFNLAGAFTYTVITPVADPLQPGSLAWAIDQANSTSGLDIIDFNLDPTANSITVHAPLTISDPVDIQGNSITVGGDSTINCFVLALGLPGSSGSRISNLIIGNTQWGIRIQSNGNTIVSCRIGTDGTNPLSNYVGIRDEGQGNQLGLPGQGNTISGNTQYGIYLANARGSCIQGNYIGTNDLGTAAITQFFGITLDNSQQCMIGGSRALGQGNLISGHTFDGIQLRAGSFGNTICGNTIGLDRTENVILANGDQGIWVDQVPGNAIGLPGADFENICAGNGFYGIYATTATGLILRNNFIGLNLGSQVFANGLGGIKLVNTNSCLIGGNLLSSERNVVSGHSDVDGGIYIEGNGNTVSGNYIGTNALGTEARPNFSGIKISGNGNRIGGPNEVANFQGNIISGNTTHGIFLLAGDSNQVVGNYIGLNTAGDAALSNGNYGINTCTGNNAVTRNVFGSLATNERNVISSNVSGEFLLHNYSTSNNRLLGNYLGLNATGTDILPSASALSLILQDGTNQNLIQDNVMARKVQIITNACGNTLIGNRIGVFPSGAVIPGMENGLEFLTAAHGNLLGTTTPGQGNLIANVEYGVVLQGIGTEGNRISGNTITAFLFEGISLTSGGNNGYSSPVINTAYETVGISGTAQNFDWIEVFIAERDYGRGGSLRWIGSTTADGFGQWFLVPGGYVNGDYVCATASKDIGASGINTSMYCENVRVDYAIPTPTNTPTFTSTSTPTFTPTSTPTPTVTPTFTSSSSPTPTNTFTPTATDTPSQTATQTITPTFSATPTFTFTPTITNTPQFTATPSVTSTPSISPTYTFTPSYTITATISPTFTMSSTGTPSPTATISPTSSPSPSCTPTPTITLTRTLTPTTISGSIIIFPIPAQEKIYFQVPASSSSQVNIHIYNISGERAAQLTSSAVQMKAGVWELVWNCRTSAAGIYLARILVDGQCQKTAKLVVLK